ncbi:hypothetical protein [Candidatus Marithrix sp. Canyon 246]
MYDLAFTPDSKRVVTASNDKRLGLWQYLLQMVI